ncbi:MAG: Conserved repeat protein [Pseudonocardiales bacterium]|nr:Conserved repeat protein [Pseudonocardiales bacterium]
MAGFRSGFTTRASCLIAAGTTALLCGLLLGAVDLVRAGALALAIPLTASLVVYRSRVRIANRRSADPARASAGGAVSIHLAITNRSLLPTGALLLEDQLPQQLVGRARFVVPGLASREARTVSYRMPELPRGRYRAGPLRIRLTDPFHMVDVVRSFTATNDFIVTPVIDPLPSVEPPRSYDIGDNAGSHSIGVHGADDASTREYRTGDDLRKIHWRSSARTGMLMVRQEERPWQGQSTMLLDLRAAAHSVVPEDGEQAPDPRQRSSLEWAISAAASIGTHLLLAGRGVGLISDLVSGERMYLDGAPRLSDHLAGVRAVPQPDLSPIAELARTAARDSALVAVLGRLDPTSLRVLADAHPRGSSIPAFALLLDTATWRDPSGAGDGGCAATARVLSAAGWRVVVVRHGDTTAGAWQSLLRSRSGGDVALGARR